ncbi:MAG: multiheme c-type cytochrome [Planctomycetota bacterium]|nr:multiheme c-type cytochrome [Planctomycetota bacterium]
MKFGALIAGMTLMMSNAMGQQDPIARDLNGIGHTKRILDVSIDSLHHPELGLRGAASCAGSSCHGGPRPGSSTQTALRGSEYALWKEIDPHARSWRTLASKESEAILTKLKILSDGQIKNAAAYKNCLACHNTNQEMTDDLLTPSIAEGVGCEMCHGPSEPWYDRHYSGAKFVLPGMTNIQPLITRAKMCTVCHVGSTDRDMNHEIVAAGHPALYFDMAVYHERYPKHWREKDEASPDMRARLWLAGQIAMADSELELAEARATQSHSVSTWPELALYQCTDCHVSLNGLPRAPTSSDRQRLISGTASVRGWNLDGIESWQRSKSNSENDDLVQKLLLLKDILQDRSDDVGDIINTTSQLRSLINEEILQCNDLSLGDWNQRKQRQIANELGNGVDVSRQWESASRFYLAAWASSPRDGAKELMTSLHTMRRAVLFPPSTQSPQFPRTASSTTPPNFEQWSSALNQAANLLMKEEPLR